MSDLKLNISSTQTTEIHNFSHPDEVLTLAVIAPCAQDPGANSPTWYLVTQAVHMQQWGHLTGMGISWTELFFKSVLLKNTSISFCQSSCLCYLSLFQHLFYLCSDTITIYLCSVCRCWFYIYQFSDRNVNRCNAEDKQGHLQDWAVRPVIAFSDTHHPFFTCYSAPKCLYPNL